MSRNIITNKGGISDAEKELYNTIKGKLLFTRQLDRMCALLIQDDRLKAVQVIEDTPSKIGAVYVAKVKNVVKNIDACFVEIAEGEICFLPLKETSSSYLINRKYDGRILEGDELLVQVTRDAQKTKQASVTAKISISNDAFAISLGDTQTGYSSKLSKQRKQGIAQFLEQNKIQENGRMLPLWEQSSPELNHRIPTYSAGIIVRTLARDLTDEELLNYWIRLREEWNNLLQTALHRTCFSCLIKPSAGFVTVLEHLVYNYEYQEIITDDAALYKQLKEYCQRTMPNKHVRLYEDTTFSLSKLYSLDSKLDTALKPLIWLKSGGYLIIEHTEALTVIDVNSGKIEGRKSKQETIFKTNQEAAEEIALQLRLRNLSGIIVVDFINMDTKEQQLALVEQLKNAVRADRQKTTVVDITPLGLVEITRKKSYKPLHEQFM